ncbi:uncharacterized protein CMU_039840 [Cryptosporidium muris RN66]|uniref:Uncharacterized protein n=1 Tax=Cryptosporidium muris (strain RN66) TaxID=441375 RepID=B6A9M4_CRYMR|nr:uncharacterized protein CMU_039840 [Cryptosporidium muris RN66]EEA04915.1 hypothetical protein, conserved [Cryptosporidium muris RN66]|eukprot:XP_002139264.1 hypothetical protein [Cryptosporidium muris RN66]
MKSLTKSLNSATIKSTSSIKNKPSNSSALNSRVINSEVYDGLIEDEQSSYDLNIKDNTTLKSDNNTPENSSFSSSYEHQYSDHSDSDEESSIVGSYLSSSSQFDQLKDLKPMDTYSWLKNHGFITLSNKVIRDANNATTTKISDKVLSLYEYDNSIDNISKDAINSLFMLTLKDDIPADIEYSVSSKDISKPLTLRDLSMSHLSLTAEGIPESKTQEDEEETIYDSQSLVTSRTNETSITHKTSSNIFITPKLMNRLDITEGGISGENALAFQKYIRDLQDEVKMKDEKLRLREMERDNARLTRNQLTRAVRASLQIGHGAGRLHILIMNIRKKLLGYGMRMILYNSKLPIRNRNVSLISAAASVLENVVLRRLRVFFVLLSSHRNIKSNDDTTSASIASKELVITRLIHTLKLILPAFKLVTITRYNHHSAMKKFLYIWAKCCLLRDNVDESEYIYVDISERLPTILSLYKIKTTSKLKLQKDRKKVNKIKNIENKSISSSLILQKNISTSFEPNSYESKTSTEKLTQMLSKYSLEPLSYLDMIREREKEREEEDQSRIKALDHLSNIIKTSLINEFGLQENLQTEMINKTEHVIQRFKSRFTSYFENLAYESQKMNIVEELRNISENKFGQPIEVPKWLKKQHISLLEQFYSNPFYPVFVNTYNKLLQDPDVYDSSEESLSASLDLDEISSNHLEITKKYKTTNFGITSEQHIIEGSIIPTAEIGVQSNLPINPSIIELNKSQNDQTEDTKCILNPINEPLINVSIDPTKKISDQKSVDN